MCPYRRIDESRNEIVGRSRVWARLTRVSASSMTELPHCRVAPGVDGLVCGLRYLQTRFLLDATS